jgi:hypothetical protein
MPCDVYLHRDEDHATGKRLNKDEMWEAMKEATIMYYPMACGTPNIPKYN